MIRAFPKKTVAAVFGASVFLLGTQEARADLWGADLGPLSALVEQAGIQIAQLADTIATLRQTYDEAKRVASYADDAAQAFKNFEKFGAQVFSGQLEEAMDRAFPDLAYFQREASNTGPWAQGTGELSRVIRYCVGRALGAEGCAEAREALSLRQTREALAATFGTAPVVAGAIEVRAMDHEAAFGMSIASAQLGRDAVAREQARALMKRCTGGTDDDSIAACQAAAHAASILGVEQSADLGDQLAQANRLHAVRIAQENGRRKREINEALERRRLILEGAGRLGDAPVQVRTEGLQVFDEGSAP
jgi:hypothetical protein